MPIASARVSEELHERIQNKSVLQGVLVSDFIRNAIEESVNGGIQPEGCPPHIDDSPTFALATDQLKEKDQQISELHQLLAVSQKSVQQLTEQNQLLLTDNRKPSWWTRLLARN